MKKLIFMLLGMSLCLAATAARPQLPGGLTTWGKPDVSLLKKKQIVRDRWMSAPVACDSRNVLAINQFFTQRGVTPDDNLLMKRAPHRLNADDVMSSKILFLMCYDFDFDTEAFTLSKCYFDGGWNVEMEQVGDGVFNAYTMLAPVPATVNVDYNTGTAELQMGYLGGWQWSDTTTTGFGTRKTTIVTDTTEYVYLIDEGYFMGENEDFTHISGQVYQDGSIYFPDGWSCYTIDYVTINETNYRGVTTTTQDTVMSITPFYRDTYMMTPNAVHDYDIDYSEYGYEPPILHETNDVYMFQYDDTTAVVWNIWGMGGRGVCMYVRGDGSMTLPAYQVAGTTDVAIYEEAYPEYDWSEGYENVIVAYDMEAGQYTASDLMGEVTPEALSWGATVLWNYCILDGNYYALSTFPLTNNEVHFVNDERFMLGTSASPVINFVVFDDHVVVTAEPMGENASVYLFNNEGVMVENPCAVARTEEDQHLLFSAVESDYGKNISEMVTVDILVPALEKETIIGDVNGDNTISLHDVILLIDYLVNGCLEGDVSIQLENADIDQDGVIGLNDVAALASLIVEGH